MSSTDNGLMTAYRYDAAGREHGHTLMDSATWATMVLDPQGRLTAIGENAGGTGPYISTLGYNPDDLPITVTLPGGAGSCGVWATTARTG